MRAFLPHLMSGVVGVAYPAYQSHVALTSNDHEKTILWLQYWIVLAMISIPEFYVDRVFYYSPLYLFYNVAKIGLLVWLVHPGMRGFNKIFTSYIEPHFVLLWNEGEQDSIGRSALAGLKTVLSI